MLDFQVLLFTSPWLLPAGQKWFFGDWSRWFRRLVAVVCAVCLTIRRVNRLESSWRTASGLHHSVAVVCWLTNRVRLGCSRRPYKQDGVTSQETAYKRSSTEASSQTGRGAGAGAGGIGWGSESETKNDPKRGYLRIFCVWWKTSCPPDMCQDPNHLFL